MRNCDCIEAADSPTPEIRGDDFFADIKVGLDTASDAARVQQKRPPIRESWKIPQSMSAKGIRC